MTLQADEEVTMEMLKRGLSQKEGRVRTQMSDCSIRGTLETVCSRPSRHSQRHGKQGCSQQRGWRGKTMMKRMLNTRFMSPLYP